MDRLGRRVASARRFRTYRPVRIVVSVIGLVLAGAGVIGLPAVPDVLPRWLPIVATVGDLLRSWFAPLTGDLGRWLFVVAGIGLLVFVNWPSHGALERTAPNQPEPSEAEPDAPQSFVDFLDRPDTPLFRKIVAVMAAVNAGREQRARVRAWVDLRKQLGREPTAVQLESDAQLLYERKDSTIDVTEEDIRAHLDAGGTILPGLRPWNAQDQYPISMADETERKATVKAVTKDLRKRWKAEEGIDPPKPQTVRTAEELAERRRERAALWHTRDEARRRVARYKPMSLDELVQDRADEWIDKWTSDARRVLTPDAPGLARFDAPIDAISGQDWRQRPLTMLRLRLARLEEIAGAEYWEGPTVEAEALDPDDLPEVTTFVARRSDAAQPEPAEILALWEEADEVTAEIARGGRPFGPDSRKPPLNKDQEAADVRYRDWLGRCRHLVRTHAVRFVPDLTAALKAPHRAPEVREERSILDPTMVQGTFVVPPPDPRLDVIEQVKKVLADILKATSA